MARILLPSASRMAIPLNTSSYKDLSVVSTTILIVIIQKYILELYKSFNLIEAREGSNIKSSITDPSCDL